MDRNGNRYAKGVLGSRPRACRCVRVRPARRRRAASSGLGCRARLRSRGLGPGHEHLVLARLEVGPAPRAPRCTPGRHLHHTDLPAPDHPLAASPPSPPKAKERATAHRPRRSQSPALVSGRAARPSHLAPYARRGQVDRSVGNSLAPRSPPIDPRTENRPDPDPLTRGIDTGLALHSHTACFASTARQQVNGRKTKGVVLPTRRHVVAVASPRRFERRQRWPVVPWRGPAAHVRGSSGTRQAQKEAAESRCSRVHRRGGHREPTGTPDSRCLLPTLTRLN